MLDLLRQLLGLHTQSPGLFRELQPLLRVVLHSDALTQAVRATQSPVDDLVLRLLRALIPQE